MRQLFIKIYIILILNVVILKNAQSEIFIVAKVNEEIITNLDVDFEKSEFKRETGIPLVKKKTKKNIKTA